MGKCRAGIYTNNLAVAHGMFICLGGLDKQPPCEYLNKCAKEHGMRLRLERRKKKKK